MRKLATFSIVVMLLLLTSAPAAASQSYTLTIFNPIDFSSGDQFPSPFTASGPAVDEGLFCASGTAYTTHTIMAGPPDIRRTNFQVTKLFVCQDGSGAIEIFVHAHVNNDSYENTGQWNVLSGTGDYARLKGRGSQVGEATDVGVNDTYTGWVIK